LGVGDSGHYIPARLTNIVAAETHSAQVAAIQIHQPELTAKQSSMSIELDYWTFANQRYAIEQTQDLSSHVWQEIEGTASDGKFGRAWFIGQINGSHKLFRLRTSSNSRVK
jgi:hypothetical protein